jgi:hypothetical protein
MPTTIRIKKSGATGNIPANTTLEYGELALNYADGILYFKNADDEIQQISGTTANTFETINANGSLLIADSNVDILSIVAGSGIHITGTPLTDSYTITARLNDTVVSTDTTQSGTANSVKTAYDVATTAYGQANLAYGQANSAYNQANLAYTAANNARVTVFANNGAANSSTQNINFVNTSTVLVSVANTGDNANISFVTTDIQANAAYAQANAAYDQANLAYTAANNSNLKSGGVINGTLNVTQDLIVGGNIYLEGNTTFINVATYSVEDALIYLAANNYLTDSVDIGFIGGKNTSGIYSHTGFARDATDAKWKLFDNLPDEAHVNNVIDFANSTIATLVANLEAQSILLGGNTIATQANLTLAHNQANSAYGQANLAYDQANSAYGQANLAYTQANAAYGQANNAYGQANLAYNAANNARVTVFANNGAANATTQNINFVNTSTIIVSVANTSGNGDVSFTATDVQANAAYAQANSAYGQANLAYTQANNAYGQANLAYDAANNARVTLFANSGSANATTQNINFVNTATIIVNVANTSGNGNVSFVATDIQANAAYAQANDAYTQANTARDTANAAYNQANNALSSASNAANTARVSANGGSTLSSRQLNFVNTGSVLVIVNDALDGNANISFTTLSGANSVSSVFTANGVSNTYTMTTSIVDANNAIVTIDGVVLIPNQDYSINGQILTINYIPANGSKVEARSITGGGDGKSNGSLGFTRSSFVGDGVTTDFTLSIPAIDEDNTLVFVDRVLQRNSEYNVSTTLLTFTGAPDANAVIDVFVTQYLASNLAVMRAGDVMTGQLNISSGGLLVTGNVGIGTASPTTNLHVVGTALITQDLTVSGNLFVEGNVTTFNVSNLEIEDNDIVLNANTTGAPSLNATITIDRGTSTNTFLRWNESTDRWGWSDDGSTFTPFSDALLKTGDTMTGQLNVQNVIPTTSNTYNLGSSSARFKDLWLSNSTIYLGDTSISANGSVLVIPAIQTASGVNLESQLANSYTQANSAYGQANNAYGQANSAYTQANSAYGQANSAYDQANLAYTQANSAYGAANNRVLKAGDTMTGQLNISSGGLLVTGNVGIGTTNPSETLEVAGRAKFVNSSFNYLLIDSTLSDSYLRLAAAGAVKWYFRNNISNSNALEITSDTGSANGIFLTQGGNLGIGTNSPSFGLSVEKDNGSGYIATFRASNTSPYITFQTTSGITQIQGINSAFSATNHIAMQLSGGNVGIGTASPVQKLHVVGAVQADDFRSAISSQVFYLTGDEFRFRTSGGTERLRVDANGNVSIGVATAVGKLHIHGNDNSRIKTLTRNDSSGSSARAEIVVNAFGNSWGLGVGSTANNNNAFYINEDSNSTDITRFTILTGGNVGIGTTTPGNALHVVGSANVTSSIYIGSDGVRLSSDGAGELGVGYGQTATNRRFSVYNNTTLAFTVTPTGNVGIGTSSPGAKLEAYRNSSGEVARFTAAADGLRSLKFISSDNTGSGAVWTRDIDSAYAQHRWAKSGTPLMVLNESGNLGIGTSSPVERLQVSGGGLKVTGASTVASGSGAGLYLNYVSGSNYGEILALDQGVAWKTLRLNSADIHFYIANGEQMRLNTSGNLGLGVTPSAWSSSWKSFDIGGSGSLAFTGAGSNDYTLAINAYYDSTDSRWEYKNTGDKAARYQITAAGTHAWFVTGTTGTANNPITFGDAKMFIDSAGNVGIGITNPDSYGKFVVSGTGYVSHFNATSGAVGFGLYENGTGRFYIKTLNGSDGLAFIDGDGTSERMRITGEGSLLVNTTTDPTSGGFPKPPLSIKQFTQDSVGFTGIHIEAANDQSVLGIGYDGTHFDFDTSYRITGAYRGISFSTVGSKRLIIDVGGDITPGANGTQNLGSTTARWATVFTSDLDLNNGVGDWTIVEGEDDLFIYNNKRGKVYKFKLEEVDPSTATPKKDN